MDHSDIVCHENLECLLSAKRAQYLHAVATSAPGYDFFAHNLPSNRLIPLNVDGKLRPFLNDDAMLRHSDLAAQISRARVSAFVPSYRSSTPMERWAQGAGIELLSPSRAVQKELEDKLLFDRLLRRDGQLPVPQSFELTGPEQVDGLKRFPVVCQIPQSEGMDGTFLATSPKALRHMLDNEALRFPLLCRDFIDGRVLGITIVIGSDGLILSALRDQCRSLHRRHRDLAGIQWLSHLRLTRIQRGNIEETMARLGERLREARFFGAASVDFILDGERPLIIECNPRFSSASPHLSAESSLLHGLDFFDEYLRAVSGQPLSAHLPRLPDSTFEGAYVDFSDHLATFLKSQRRRLVRSLPRLGVHDFSTRDLRFVSTDLADLNGAGRLLFYYSSPEKSFVSKRTDFGSLFTNFSLFALQGKHLVPTDIGTSLLAQLRAQV